MTSGRRGFTLLEVMFVVVLIGIMATLVVSRIAPREPDGLISLNRYLSDIRSEAMDRGPLILTVEDGSLTVLDGSLESIDLRSELPDGSWQAVPERILFYRDGSCSPGRLILKGAKGEESFLIAVTGRAYEVPR
ncbi:MULTISPECIES: prepilin-type N-terminal cleavage/methylation domain-containing protein [Dethiosulfovibrio]|uniref:Prepilin-type N-terminal cleavage/methylation domain-containing protein n=2 Tax=Dethiosulfovibrio TaxID=47054 RepID=A0ABS9EMH7_9BACT|nr:MULTISPECIES: prepilin-type N-terminal cleavage/methylation domain-containing protein [Dethiosulfovibrio]MCF4113841.1 prepilin-type N-terminal cleavage/methylation domain-containing protein [Dethiosulfovibrio russensis]MCF4141746.1 prepilin-type N-terminal cleavage/methylation domain-containing protein [Dethiosulfovibrio marinus]MCF4143837.1 prepilin-type N-terminal cleavage/methylation domain-containing protein [Dethiosulfovibrio acidaminovorans]